MKLFFPLVLLFFYSSTYSASKIAIQQECESKQLPLYVAEGDFIKEENFRLPIQLTKDFFTAYIIDKYSEIIEKEIIQNILKNIFSKINSKQRNQLRTVTKKDLLIDLSTTCTYSAIIEHTQNQNFLISPHFDKISRDEQYYYILEAINFPLTPNYSDVGNRNFAYALLDENYKNKTEKERLELKKYAGNTVFYKDNTYIDINRVNFYNEKNGSISIASLIKDSPIITPNGICKSSDIRPVKFENDGILSVFTVSEPCELVIGNKTYITRENSVVQIKNYGIFTDDPMPKHISSLYVKTDFTIKNKNVNLKASKDPTKKSKLHFSDDASGEIIAYTQFQGEVNFRGRFYKIKDYFNLAKHINSDFITMMTLTENVEVFQAGYKNDYTHLIRLSEKGHITSATITGQNPKLMIRGKSVNIKPNTEVMFLYNDPDKVLQITPREPTRLLSIDGSLQVYEAGLPLNFTIEGLVKLR